MICLFIAHWADTIPYFKKGGVKGLARSMPTSKAIDLVAQKKGFNAKGQAQKEEKYDEKNKRDAGNDSR